MIIASVENGHHLWWCRCLLFSLIIYYNSELHIPSHNSLKTSSMHTTAVSLPKFCIYVMSQVTNEDCRSKSHVFWKV